MPELQPYQQRVIQEKADLDTKVGLLVAFMSTETYAIMYGPEYGLLEDQLDIMREYSAVLGKRIGLFT